MVGEKKTEERKKENHAGSEPMSQKPPKSYGLMESVRGKEVTCPGRSLDFLAKPSPR